MSRERGKNTPTKQTRPQGARPRPQQTAEVEAISPVGLIGAIAAAVVIAGILLFVINARINATRPALPTPAPVATVRPAQPTTPPAATQAPTGVSQPGGFSKGNPQAKVTLVEFADFK